VSSANLETGALIDRPERKVTGESGILMTDAGEARRLARFFTRMWHADCRWEAPQGEAYALARGLPTSSPCRPNPPFDGRAGVIWTHDDADLEFLVSPTQAQLNARLGADWRQPWPEPALAKVSVDDEAWHALTATEPPVLYTHSHGATRLHAGGGEWALAGSRLTMTKTPHRASQTQDMMNSWWARSASGERRGFCSAVLVRE